MNRNPKIVTIQTLKKKLPGLRRRGVKIAFTNGCFDILHAGHVHYLSAAKKGKRALIVGLNSDRSVKKIKGPKRPIINEHDRATLLSALSCVDFVVLFHEETPRKLIEALKPDILIKGADWKNKGAVGSQFVKDNGGKVEFLRYIKGLSTTDLIRRIKQNG